MDEGVVDHVMIRVEQLEESLDWYRSNLGYVEYGRGGGEDFTIVKIGPKDKDDQGALLELTHNHDGRTYEMGDAWGHIAVRVEDVSNAYEELMDAGVSDYRDPESTPGEYAFVTDPEGHEIEIVPREYGAQWSLDHTMMRVENADEALGWFTRKFGYAARGRWEADSFANYFVGPPDAPREAMDLELTYNYDGRSYEMGDAWGHLAVACHELEDFWESLLIREAEDYRDPASCDFRYAFTRDTDGHEFELVERSPN